MNTIINFINDESGATAIEYGLVSPQRAQTKAADPPVSPLFTQLTCASRSRPSAAP